MLDMHVHVWPHEPGTPTPTLAQLERYCDAATKQGISQIAITEHCYRFTRITEHVLPHWTRPAEGPLAEATNHVLAVEGGGDLDAYIDVLLQAQQAGLPVLVGLEVDWLPGTSTAMSSVLSDYPFDVLLGSVHWLDDWLFDAYGNEVFGAEWNTRDLDDVYGQYVDSVVGLAQSGLVDVLAHVDVIKVAGFVPEHLAEHEQRLIDGLAGTDIVIELSSAGLLKPVADLYPGASLLRGLLDAGLRLTTASDAHTWDKIGTNYDQLARTLDEHAVDELITFDRRTPITTHR